MDEATLEEGQEPKTLSEPENVDQPVQEDKTLDSSSPPEVQGKIFNATFPLPEPGKGILVSYGFR